MRSLSVVDKFRNFKRQDFTAENIQFLREVRNFKRKWRRLTTRPHTDKLLISGADERVMYEDAARIYFELVCPETSTCSINVDSKTLRGVPLYLYIYKVCG